MGQGKKLTVIHLHLNATSLTVFSGIEAAIFMYFIILGSSVYLKIQIKSLQPNRLITKFMGVQCDTIISHYKPLDQ